MGLRQKFNGDKGFPGGETAVNHRAGARCYLRSHRIDIEAQVNAGSFVGGDVDGFADDCRHSQFVNHVDREHGDSGLLHPFRFLRVDIPSGNLHAVLYLNVCRILSVIHHAVRTVSAHCRERHAVHVAGVGGLLVVPVSVSINPDDTDTTLVLICLAHRGNAAGGNAVVTSQHQRETSPGQGSGHLIVQLAVHVDDLLVISHGLRGFAPKERENISLVVNVKAHPFQIIQKPGVANGGRAHGNASLGSPKIHLNTDYVN